ncbi:PAS domain S-box protein [Pelagicoccus sp. SDUM812003]|uniref:PAS domain S-box protein n=1 Tax=Pelagicoccus sp. SDUM812003 TaxID=3041267 RepID=UPI00280D32C2|nr:PAS domain S-box protein [Pelagicoccus sp. SDUM812003]MDQ8203855.1 PAS domain S-box protein [Pelagicoccus sp. SDUM812003]
MPSNASESANVPFDEILGYEAAFSCLPDPVFIYNHSLRRVINANEAAVRRYGYTAEEIKELSPWDVEAPYDEKELLSRIEKLKQEGSVVYRAEHRSASGERFPAEVHTTYRNFDGVEIFVAICREITDRLEAEQRLEQAETHYRAVFENVVSLICVANLKTATFLDVNPAFERLLGYRKSELIDRPFTDFIHPEDLDPTLKKIEEMRRVRGLKTSFQNRYRCKSGRYVWLDWSPQELPDEELVYAVAQDITEKKWFEQRLRQQNQHMRLHVEQTPLGVIEWSLDFRVTAWNSAAERIFGYSEEEALGQKGTFILQPRVSEQVKEVWNRLISNTGGERSINTNLHKNGSELLCEWHNTSLVDESGKIIGVASLVLDVTDQEHRKRELEQAKESAEKANQAKSEFLSMMSHELRTPLNSIVGPCELIKEQVHDTSLEPLLDVMLTSSSHLLDLINSILDLSKIESGSIEVNPEDYAVNDFFEQRLLPLRVNAMKKRLAFNLQINTPPATILRTDGRLLLQALFNIVGNAVKFTSSGSVTIRIEALESKLRIDVVDTGPGIDRELQKKLFEPFRQGAEALSKTQRGSGLGLSITKRLIELLGGTISFSSVPQNGTTFSLTIPSIRSASVGPSKRVAKAVDVPSSQGQNRKILLVEDEPNNQLVNSALLRFLGYSHDIASTGEEAVEMWMAHRYAVVLMDIKLPGIDGIEATSRIRACAGDGERVFVIAQSAHALSEQREEFLRQGMDDYLSKPISLEALKSLLKSVMEKVESDR